MALFNKKKSQDAAAPATAPVSTSAATDDFSDFSPEALAAEPAAADPKGGKGKKGVAKADKKVGNGRGVKPGTVIGLNIGNDSIKVLEATSKGSDITVTAMGMVPTPADSLSNGVVMSANALVMGIRDAMAQAGIKSKKVVTSISGTGALVVRVVEVPKMSDTELLDNMKMDADRYIPFPPSEVEMDFKALRELPSDPDSPNMEVLLAAAQREIIDLHVQVVQDAKLDPRAIDVEPLATARALTHPLTTKGDALANGAATLGGDADYNDVSATLNIGASGTEISILRGDILVFTRTVPTGGNALTQALVDTLGLAWSDAEQLKREMGDALPPTSDAAATAPAAGFGDATGGDDWSEFDETATPANANGAADGDAFDDDFFAQGPPQKEPGEQHQQKEADDAAPKNTPDPATFFNFGDETEPEEKMPTLDDGRPKSFADLLGEEKDDMDELPTLTPDAPPATALPSAFDFPDEFTSPTASPDADDRDLPTLQGGAPASTETVGDVSNIDAEDASVLPSEAAPAAAPFSFSFDSPAPAPTPPSPAPPAPAAPAPATPEAAPAAALDAFDFGFETPAAPEKPSLEKKSAPAEADPFAEFMASAGDEAATATATPTTTTPAAAAPAAAPAPTEDFDLDSIFNEDATTGATGVAGTDDIGLGDFGGIAGNDFSDDLADFGAGLGGASAGEIDARTLHSVLSPVLDNLVNEVRRSLEYHTTRYPEAAVRRVTIVGGGAKLKNLDAYLTQQLGLPTTIGNPVLRLSLNAPKLPPGYVEENGTLFTVALGLAMRELTK